MRRVGVARSRALTLLVLILLVAAWLPAGAAGRELADGPTRAAPVDRALREKIAQDPRAVVPILVQRSTAGAAVPAVRASGGNVGRQLKLGKLLAAAIPASAVDALAREPGVLRISYDAPVRLQGTTEWDARPLASIYPQVIGAPNVWGLGSTARGGVTVAVLDSGLREHEDFLGANKSGKKGGRVRVLRRVAIATDDRGGPDDDYGHGTFVAGIVAGRGWGDWGFTNDPRAPRYAGVAPDANLVSVKVSDKHGVSRTSDVLAGIQWVVDNKDRYQIRVLNLSLSSSVAESYRTSLLDAAVEFAWFKGIVVVVAAGNGGPGSVQYPPANDPYVIVVGGTDDQGTPAVADDRLASWSAYGTTQDGYARPDLVAPGRRIVSTLASADAALAQAFPDRIVQGHYIRLSGTSAAAPVVSGAASLLLQHRADLSADQVKWLLQHTAQTVAGPGTGAGYSRVDAAVRYTGAVERGNQGLSPNLYLQRAYADHASTTTFTENGWDSVDWSECGWDAVAWTENGWDTTRFDENGWDVAGAAAAPGPVSGD